MSFHCIVLLLFIGHDAFRFLRAVLLLRSILGSYRRPLCRAESHVHWPRILVGAAGGPRNVGREILPPFVPHFPDTTQSPEHLTNWKVDNTKVHPAPTLAPQIHGL